MTSKETKFYESYAHSFVATFDNPAGDQWPEGFIEAMDDESVNKEAAYQVVRWEFEDGSAIVEINGFWDYGIHCDHLEAACELVDPDNEEDDPLFIWPESHFIIPTAWQTAPQKS